MKGLFKQIFVLCLFAAIGTIAKADIPNNTIYYTTSDGTVCTPYFSDASTFGADIVSNTYTTGQGIITFDGNVTNIGSYAFFECSNLTSITIPNSVTSIVNNAFSGCSGLASVTIPNSVTSIGSSAFENCSNLTLINIPNSVTSIGGYVFRNCSVLTSVTIPNSVSSIGMYAFYGCSGLTSITIPNSVTSIGKSAFYGTSWYNNQPDGLLYLDNCLIGYKGNKPTGNLNVKSDTRVIACGAFESCRALTSVNIPNSVTSIGAHAFSGCISLTSLSIGDGVTSIEYEAFDGIGWYDNQPDGLLYLDNCLIGYKGNKPKGNLNVKSDTRVIAGGAFEYCRDLTSIDIPNSVTSIGERAFYDCM